MWDKVLEYFLIEQDSDHITSYKLKKRYRKGKNFRYLLIVQESGFVVYSSISKRERSLVVNKNLFYHKKDAELFIREEILEIINKNILFFIFGTSEE
ncbi:hypothetical protein MZM54_02615 [[Brevibacterium] frigoritolerans]|nr:hypothetical protein [Peribacillus frigoritolerans]